MKKFMYFAIAMMFVSCGNQQQVDTTINGNFEGSGQGRNGEITVNVDVEQGKIVDIQVLESAETPEYALPVIEQIVATIVASNNINVDSVSGASLTSEGLLSAISNALTNHLPVFRGKKTKLVEPQMTSSASVQSDTTSSASIVPKEFQQTVRAKGFTSGNNKKVLIVYGDPRKYSVLSDMVNTTVKYFMDNGFEVELRDLYKMRWNPILTEEEFYYQKDGKGTAPAEVVREQELVTQADYVIFAYPNWHDTPIAIVKGYMERVFASTFAYGYSAQGPTGLLNNKGIYTIMNAGFLGGGRGNIGDGIINKNKWDQYMRAFEVLDNDTAVWWGMTNMGRFVNDRTPKNDSTNYAQEIASLRTDLTTKLSNTFIK